MGLLLAEKEGLNIYKCDDRKKANKPDLFQIMSVKLSPSEPL